MNRNGSASGFYCGAYNNEVSKTRNAILKKYATQSGVAQKDALFRWKKCNQVSIIR